MANYSSWSITAHVDNFSPIVNRIRYYEGKLRKSVNAAGVKEAINKDIYAERWRIYKTPVITGALDQSPNGKSRIYTSPSGNVIHFADGGIDENGIHYDPFTISPSYPKGYRYAEQSGFTPMWDIRQDIAKGQGSIVLNIVKRHIMEEL
jgi:hypothetical protein